MRMENRSNNQIRSVKITRGVIKNAEGSALIELGETRVLVTASVENKIPQWLKEGKSTGWITAEYGMLPRSTLTRTPREKSSRSGRTYEIQRLIGRALRAVVDLPVLGERSIILDCDVLQADGGTRTAAITGAMVALIDALDLLVEEGKIKQFPVKKLISAVSAGMVSGDELLDLNYEEDSQAEVDINIVMTEDGELVEVQGTGEKGSFTLPQFNSLLELARQGIKQLIKAQRKALKEVLAKYS